jgi:hypothetical protein
MSAEWIRHRIPFNKPGLTGNELRYREHPYHMDYLVMPSREARQALIVFSTSCLCISRRWV